MAFETFQSEKSSKFYFRLKAKNGEVILQSEAKDGSPYFVLKAKNGEIIGRSEMYSSKSAMENGIKLVMRNAQTGGDKDLT